jgi:hypothetical protein
MIDHQGLHAKIKATLKPDSPMPEGVMIDVEHVDDGDEVRDIYYAETLVRSGEGYDCFASFHPDFEWTEFKSIKWFANALQIPLEDNGYTDLVKAAELQIKLNDQWREAKTDEQFEAWSNYAFDGEIELRAALERIKNETHE